MTLTSEAPALDDAKMSSYMDDLKGLPQLNRLANIRSSAPLEEKVQVLVESPSRFTVKDSMARGYPSLPSAPTPSCNLGDAVNYALPVSARRRAYDAARNYDGICSWPASPRGIEIGSPLRYNQLVPVAAPVCYSPITPMAPPSVVLEQHMQILHCQLQKAREDAKDDVLRCAREAARGFESLKVDGSRKSNTSEVEDLRSSLSASRSECFAKDSSLIELRRQLDQERESNRQLQSDLELVRAQSEAKVVKIKEQAGNNTEELQQSWMQLTNDLHEVKSKLAEREMTITSLKQSGDFKEKCLQQLQGDLERLRTERDALKRTECLVQGAESEQIENLRKHNERLRLELAEAKGKDVEREMAIASLKRSVDFKDQHIERLNGDLESIRIERDAGIQKESLRFGAQSEQIEKLQKRVDILTAQREELNQKVLSSEASQRQCERIVISLRDDVDAEKNKVIALEIDLQVARSESEDTAIDAQGELDSVRRKLEDAHDEIEDLKLALWRSDDEIGRRRAEKMASQNEGLTHAKTGDLIKHGASSRRY